MDHFHFSSVFFRETDQDIVVGLRKVVHDTVDVALGIFRTAQIAMLITGQAQGVTDGKMVPEELMQGGVFVDPQDFTDGNNGNTVGTRLNEIMLCDEHVLGCQLRQSGQFLLCFFQHLAGIAVRGKAADLPGIRRIADIQQVGDNAEDGKQTGDHIGEHKDSRQQAGGIRFGKSVM